MCLAPKRSFWDSSAASLVRKLNSDIKKITRNDKSWKDTLQTLLKNNKVKGRNVGIALMKLVNVYQTFARSIIGISTWRRSLKHRIAAISRIQKMDKRKKRSIRLQYPLTRINKVRLSFIRRHLSQIYSGSRRPTHLKVKFSRFQLEKTVSSLTRSEKRQYRKSARSIKKAFTKYMTNLSAQKNGTFCSCASFGQFYQKQMNIIKSKDVKVRNKYIRKLISERILPRVPKNLPKRVQNIAYKNAKFSLEMFKRANLRRTRNMINYCRIKVCGIKSVKKTKKQIKKISTKVVRGSKKPKKAVKKTSKKSTPAKKPISTQNGNSSTSQPAVRAGSFKPGVHQGYAKK